VEDGLSLTSITTLLTIVTTLTLCSGGRLSCLLLPCDGMRLVLVATAAVSVLLLRVVNHPNTQAHGRNDDNAANERE